MRRALGTTILEKKEQGCPKLEKVLEGCLATPAVPCKLFFELLLEPLNFRRKKSIHRKYGGCLWHW